MLNNYSSKEIANNLNNDIRNFQNELWTANSVLNILNNRAVLGFITPIKGTEIFDESWKIISKADFYLAQEIMEQKSAKGKTSPDGNIFLESYVVVIVCIDKNLNGEDHTKIQI